MCTMAVWFSFPSAEQRFDRVSHPIFSSSMVHRLHRTICTDRFHIFCKTGLYDKVSYQNVSCKNQPNSPWIDDTQKRDTTKTRNSTSKDNWTNQSCTQIEPVSCHQSKEVINHFQRWHILQLQDKERRAYIGCFYKNVIISSLCICMKLTLKMEYASFQFSSTFYFDSI